MVDLDGATPAFTREEVIDLLKPRDLQSDSSMSEDSNSLKDDSDIPQPKSSTTKMNREAMNGTGYELEYDEAIAEAAELLCALPPEYAQRVEYFDQAAHNTDAYIVTVLAILQNIGLSAANLTLAQEWVRDGHRVRLQIGNAVVCTFVGNADMLGNEEKEDESMQRKGLIKKLLNRGFKKREARINEESRVEPQADRCEWAVEIEHKVWLVLGEDEVQKKLEVLQTNFIERIFTTTGQRPYPQHTETPDAASFDIDWFLKNYPDRELRYTTYTIDMENPLCLSPRDNDEIQIAVDQTRAVVRFAEALELMTTTDVLEPPIEGFRHGTRAKSKKETDEGQFLGVTWKTFVCDAPINDSFSRDGNDANRLLFEYRPELANIIQQFDHVHNNDIVRRGYESVKAEKGKFSFLSRFLAETVTILLDGLDGIDEELEYMEEEGFDLLSQKRRERHSEENFEDHFEDDDMPRDSASRSYNRQLAILERRRERREERREAKREDAQREYLLLEQERSAKKERRQAQRRQLSQWEHQYRLKQKEDDRRAQDREQRRLQMVERRTKKQGEDLGDSRRLEKEEVRTQMAQKAGAKDQREKQNDRRLETEEGRRDLNEGTLLDDSSTHFHSPIQKKERRLEMEIEGAEWIEKSRESGERKRGESGQSEESEKIRESEEIKEGEESHLGDPLLWTTEEKKPLRHLDDKEEREQMKKVKTQGRRGDVMEVGRAEKNEPRTRTDIEADIEAEDRQCRDEDWENRHREKEQRRRQRGAPGRKADGAPIEIEQNFGSFGNNTGKFSGYDDDAESVDSATKADREIQELLAEVERAKRAEQPASSNDEDTDVTVTEDEQENPMGGTLGAFKLNEYMDRWFADELDPRYRPIPFNHEIRHLNATPEGSLQLVRKDAKTGADKVVRSFTRYYERGETPSLKCTLSPSQSINLDADLTINAFLNYELGTTENRVAPLHLRARARPLGAYVLMCGRMDVDNDCFAADHGIVLEGNDAVDIPLLLETLETDENYDKKLAELPTKHAAFSRSVREMKMGSPVSAAITLLLVQTKPQFETILNLPEGSLEGECEVCEQLHELFIEHEIPSDALRVADNIREEDAVETLSSTCRQLLNRIKMKGATSKHERNRRVDRPPAPKRKERGKMESPLSAAYKKLDVETASVRANAMDYAPEWIRVTRRNFGESHREWFDEASALPREMAKACRLLMGISKSGARQIEGAKLIVVMSATQRFTQDSFQAILESDSCDPLERTMKAAAILLKQVYHKPKNDHNRAKQRAKRERGNLFGQEEPEEISENDDESREEKFANYFDQHNPTKENVRLERFAPKQREYDSDGEEIESTDSELTDSDNEYRNYFRSDESDESDVELEDQDSEDSDIDEDTKRHMRELGISAKSFFKEKDFKEARNVIEDDREVDFFEEFDYDDEFGFTNKNQAGDLPPDMSANTNYSAMQWAVY